MEVRFLLGAPGKTEKGLKKIPELRILIPPENQYGIHTVTKRD